MRAIQCLLKGIVLLKDGKVIQIQKQNLMQDRSEKVEEKVCNCRNSKCMKLYCECFAAGQECGKNCRCMNCYNQKGHEHGKSAFIAGAGGPVKGNGLKEGKGCSCRKSFCIKKYCECFQEGSMCGQNCKCIDCQNNESMTNKNVLNNLKKTQSSSSNKIGSLHPIILSQSTEHLNHLISEENNPNFDEKELESGINSLFSAAATQPREAIFEHFISILKKIDSKISRQEMVFEIKEEGEN